MTAPSGNGAKPFQSCFDFVPVPESRDACARIAGELESRLSGVLPEVRFGEMRATLEAWDTLTGDDRDDFTCLMGWRAAMFLDDAWLWDTLDFAASRPAASSRPAFHAWAAAQLAPVRAYADAEIPKADSAPALAHADRVMTLDFSRPFNPGRYVHRGAVSWTTDDPSIDNELVIMALRLYPHRALADAYRLGGDTRYTAFLYKLLADLTWVIPGNRIRRCGARGPRVYWGVDALDVASRTTNLINLYAVSAAGLDADATMLVWKTLFACGARGLEFWHKKPHNIVFYEPAALGQLGYFFPAFKGAPAWREAAQRRLTNALRGSILPDGSNVEGAFGYHMAYLGSPQSVIDAARFSGLPLDPEFGAVYAAKQKVMIEYWARAATPSRTLPQLGDTWLGDTSSLLRKYGALSGSAFASAVGADDTDSDALPATFQYLPHQRFAALRSGWDRGALWAGFNLRGFHEGHDHYDLFSVELQEGPVRLLLDSGCLDYGANRERSRASAAHNTLVVDGKNHRPGAAVDIRAHGAAGFDWVEGLSLSCEGVLHRRAVCFLKPGLFLILERVQPLDAAAHRYDFYWHLPVGATVKADGLRVTAVEPAEKRTLRLDFLADAGWSASMEEGFVVNGAFTIPHAAPVVRLTAERAGAFTLALAVQTGGSPSPVPVETVPVTVFNAGEGQPLPDGQALAVRAGDDLVMWGGSGFGEKKAGDWTTDGDLLVARGSAAGSRGASCVTHRDQAICWDPLS